MPRPSSAPPVMDGPQSNLLVVEGADDWHALKALLDIHKLDERFRMIVGGGHNKMRDDMDARLLESGLERIGFIFDADIDLADRWRSVRSRMTDADCGYVPDLVPAEPGPAGTIIAQPGKVTVGVWLMPDNTLPGALEQFIRLLVPLGDPLWEHAQVIIAGLPEKHDAVTQNWTKKAHLHTWLAWQKEPGKPIGQAITKRYLDPEAHAAKPFLDWLRTLFQLAPAPTP